MNRPLFAISILCVAVLCTMLAGCDDTPPLERQVSANGRPAEMIAEVDGCRIWKIQRGLSYPVFFARCPEGAADTTSSHNEGGKNNHMVVDTTIGGRR